jgi:acyl carrier protein
MEDLIVMLQQSIVSICDLAAEEVTPDRRLDELGIDSLAVAEIVVELEIRLGRELPIDLLRRLDRVETVRDVARELEGAAGPTPDGR